MVLSNAHAFRMQNYEKKLKIFFFIMVFSSLCKISQNLNENLATINSGNF